MGLLLLGLFREVEGDHKYVPPPVELSEVKPPDQITALVAVAEAVAELTATMTVAVAVQPFASVTVTVYVVVVVGEAIGLLMVELLREAEGAHE